MTQAEVLQSITILERLKFLKLLTFPSIPSPSCRVLLDATVIFFFIHILLAADLSINASGL